MSIHVEGFEDLETELDQLRDRLEKTDGEVPISELFTDSFMRTYTEFETREELFEESPWEFETQEDFESIPGDEFDEYIDAHTDFDSWDGMVKAGFREYMLREFR